MFKTRVNITAFTELFSEKHQEKHNITLFIKKTINEVSVVKFYLKFSFRIKLLFVLCIKLTIDGVSLFPNQYIIVSSCVYVVLCM